jgi:hypothetical protein
MWRDALRLVGNAFKYTSMFVIGVLVGLVVCPVLLPLLLFVEARLARVRPFEVCCSERAGEGVFESVVLTPLRGRRPRRRDEPLEVLEMRRDVAGRVSWMRVVEYHSVAHLFERHNPWLLISQSYGSRARHGPVELHRWAAELGATVGAWPVPWAEQLHELRELRWRLERPARVVQRAWRAHRAWQAVRMRAAVAVIEAAALHALYRPGGWRADRIKARFDDNATAMQHARDWIVVEVRGA